MQEYQTDATEKESDTTNHALVTGAGMTSDDAFGTGEIPEKRRKGPNTCCCMLMICALLTAIIAIAVVVFFFLLENEDCNVRYSQDSLVGDDTKIEYTISYCGNLGKYCENIMVTPSMEEDESCGTDFEYIDESYVGTYNYL